MPACACDEREGAGGYPAARGIDATPAVAQHAPGKRASMSQHITYDALTQTRPADRIKTRTEAPAACDGALRDLPERITRAASRQAYYTVRFLADRERQRDAYRAYAY